MTDEPTDDRDDYGSGCLTGCLVVVVLLVILWWWMNSLDLSFLN